MSSPKSNPHQSKHNALNDYQRAILQAMNIPLYNLNDEFKAIESLSEEGDVPTPTVESEVDSADKSTPSLESKANNSETSESLVESEANNAKAPTPLQFIDENEPFVKQVLSVFGADQVAELGIQWQVHDSDTVVLQDKLLLSPKAEKLNSVSLKKQVWKALQPLFNGQKWS